MNSKYIKLSKKINNDCLDKIYGFYDEEYDQKCFKMTKDVFICNFSLGLNYNVFQNLGLSLDCDYRYINKFKLNRLNNILDIFEGLKNIKNEEIFILSKKSTYKYNAQKNSLIFINNKNLFKYFTKMFFVNNASIILLYTKNNLNNFSDMHVGSCYRNVANYFAEQNFKNLILNNFGKEKISK